MPLASTDYTARFTLPDMIERGKDVTLTCPVYFDGALVAPASGTFSLYEGDVAKVDAQAVTVTGSQAEYTVTAATLSSEALGEEWRVEWALTIGGEVYTFRNDAALVRRQLYPVISNVDLFRRASSLDPAGNAPITTFAAADFQDFLDESWAEINLRLLGNGNRPNLVMSPSSLRDVHLYLTLAIIFEDLATRLQDSYEVRADAFRRQYEASWARLRFLYDDGDDGVPDERSRRNASASVWLGGSARGLRWRR